MTRRRLLVLTLLAGLLLVGLVALRFGPRGGAHVGDDSALPPITDLPGGALPEGSAPREANVATAGARDGGGRPLPLPIEVEVRRGTAPVAGAVLLVNGDVIPGVVTDAAGLARIEVRSPARLWARAGSEAAVPVWLRQGEAPKRRVVLVLERQRRVSGLVIDQATQRPLPGASVFFPVIGNDVITDDHGAFRIDEHPSGRLVVIVEMEGHLVGRFFRNDPSDQSDTTLRIELLPAAPFAGRVVDPEGRPISGANVKTVSSSTDTGRQESRQLETDAEGRFSVPIVPLKGWMSIEVTAPPFTQTRKVLELPVASAELKLGYGGTVRGRCIDAAGRPVAGAEVLMVCRNADGTFAEESPTPSDEQGRFEMTGVVAGRCEARSILKDGRFAQMVEFDVADLGASELTLRFARRAAVVRGKVTDRGGRPYAYAFVEFRAPGQKEDGLGVLANAEGAYEIATLKKGEWSVLVGSYLGHSSSPPVSITFDGENDRVLDLRGAPRSFSGRVVDEEGVPVPGVAVGFSSRSRVDGTFSAPLREIDPEKGLKLRDNDGRSQYVQVAVPDGEDDFEVGDLVLRRDDFLQFEVTEPGGAAVVGARVIACATPPPDVGVEGCEGRVELGVSDGDGKVRGRSSQGTCAVASAAGFGHSACVPFEAKGREKVLLPLVPTSELRGQLFWPRGGAGGWKLLTWDSKALETESDSSGAFAFAAGRAHPKRLFAYTGDPALKRLRALGIDVTEGQPLQLGLPGVPPLRLKVLGSDTPGQTVMAIVGSGLPEDVGPQANLLAQVARSVHAMEMRSGAPVVEFELPVVRPGPVQVLVTAPSPRPGEGRTRMLSVTLPLAEPLVVDLTPADSGH